MPADTTPSTLPWPPAGLTPLRGGLDRAAVHLWASTTGTTLLSLRFLSGDRGLPMFAETDATWLAAAALMLLALWMVHALDQVRVVGVSMARGVRAGFGWMTLLEVACDRHGDTGDLIAGRGAAAERSATDRRNLRSARLLASIAPLLAAVLVLLVFVAAVRFADADATMSRFAWTIALLALAGLFLRATMQAYERSLLPRRATALASLPTLRETAPVWREAFGRLGDPEGLSVGPARGAFVAHLWHVAILLLGAFAFVAAMLVLIGATAGPVLIEVAAPQMLDLQRRHTAALALRPWALPADSSITPLDAGIALASLDHRSDRRSDVFPLRDVPRPSAMLPPPRRRSSRRPRGDSPATKWRGCAPSPRTKAGTTCGRSPALPAWT